MRRFPDGIYAEVHSLSCDFCEGEDWGYRMVRGMTAQAVIYPPLGALGGICPKCFETLGEDWHNAEDEHDAAVTAYHAGERDPARTRPGPTRSVVTHIGGGGDGGWRVVDVYEVSRGPFESREEAENA
jgi:hypothetical protein